MTHRVNPKAFRLLKNDDWRSRWMSKQNMPRYLEEDYRIREFFNKQAQDLGVEDVEIERTPNQVKVLVHTSRPGLVIGRGGEGIERIKGDLEKRVLSGDASRNLRLEVVEVRDPWSSASLLCQWIVQQLEKRVHHRRALKQAIFRAIGKKEVHGVQVQISGRLEGNEIARTAWWKEGQMPRHTLRADIDYSYQIARTKYGALGVKVWLYKGERS